MAESILQKSGGGAASDECSATKAQILTGYTAITSDSNDEPIAGTMPNRGAVSQALNCGGSYTVPAGWHNGAGKVTANSLASQTSGTATAAQIYTGKTAWVNGTKLTGTMTVSSVVSFSVAAYSTSQILCTWKNPAKGPYSGVAICAKTGGYPTNAWDGRVYTGVGSNKALNATSTATVGGLTAGTTYYFRIWVYCTCSAGEMWSNSYLQATGKPTTHGRKAFTASGTFTVPAGVRSINIHCTGGGGGGARGYSAKVTDYSGDGGGGGYTAYRNNVSVTPQQILTITVGSGGSGYTEASGGSSSAAIGSNVLVSAEFGKNGHHRQNGSSDGGSGGGGGRPYGALGYGGAGGSNGSNAMKSIGSKSGGDGQGTSTKEFGTGTLYSGGGSGSSIGSNYGPVAGGAGGGGNGGKVSRRGTSAYVYPTAGSAGTGGGGGGGVDCYDSINGGDGGSGNVVITW